MFTIEGIDLALRDLRADGIKDMKVVRLEYWDFISTETVAKVWTEGFPGWATEHAGVMETALMLRLHPELVDMSRVPTHPPASFPPYDVYPDLDGPPPPRSRRLTLSYRSMCVFVAEQGRKK